MNTVIAPRELRPETGTPAPPLEPPEPAPRRRSVLPSLGLFLLGLAVALTLIVQNAKVARPKGSAAAALRTAQASQGVLERSIRLGGTISAQRFAAIRAPQIRMSSRAGGGSELVLVRLAEAGSRVRAGDVVAEFDRQSQQQRIDDQQAQAVQAEAAKQVKQAELMTELEIARQEYRTLEAEERKAKLDLSTIDVRSAIEAEKLRLAAAEAEALAAQKRTEVELLKAAGRSAVRVAELDLEREKIDLERAEHNAERLVVRTPIDGIVVMQTTFRGGSFSQVTAGDQLYPGTYFMQIVDPQEMVLRANVNQTDVQQLRVGQEAAVRLDAYPDRLWPGRVVAVSTVPGGGDSGPRFQAGGGEHVRNLTADIAILERDPLIIPDLSASADVVLERTEPAVLAPRETLAQGENGWFVLLRRPGTTVWERRDVEIGPRNDTHAAVTAGLEPGDVLAVRPPEAL